MRRSWYSVNPGSQLSPIASHGSRPLSPLSDQSQNFFEAFYWSSLSSWSVHSPSTLWLIQGNFLGTFGDCDDELCFRFFSSLHGLGVPLHIHPLSSLCIPERNSPLVVVTQYLISSHFGYEHQFLLSVLAD